MVVSCARRNYKISWILFVSVAFSFLPTASTGKTLRRSRRSGPNLCGRVAQCCTGWQPAAASQNLCIKPICSFNCVTGICIRPNVCLCENGRYSPSCAQTNQGCSVRCLNGGTCKDDKCRCREGFTGQYCENPVCARPCLNGGKCIAPNSCACLYGFGGSTCESDYRQGPCYKEIKDLTCKGQVTTLVCTKELCCATIGNAWGIPCERCPSNPEPCKKGYLPDYESRECLDIDECKAVSDLCGENGKCRNTAGSYSCERCDVGFKFDDRTKQCEDIDECSDRIRNRCLNGRCQNTIGGFNCICDQGFILSQDGNYCTRGTDTKPTLAPAKGRDFCFKRINGNGCSEPLSVNVTKVDCCCTSIQGAGWSQRCETCPSKTTDDYNDLCVSEPVRPCKVIGDACVNGICENRGSGLQCVCKKGFIPRSSDGVCVDNDECRITASVCLNSVCRNTIGSFVCDCNQGFVRSRNPLVCERETTPTKQIPGPVTPCSREGEVCKNGICARVDGNLQCTCLQGFKFDGTSCVDRDECKEDSDICRNGRCVNREGGFECNCASGYIQIRDKKGCIDRDECKEDSRICQNGRCVNRKGGFECNCASGYIQTSDKKGCIDANECRDNNVCENGQCTNTIDGWRCTCNRGFALSFDEKSCIDIDECKSVDDICSNGVCVNTPGDFYCRCNSMYSPSTDRHMCLDTMQSQCYASFSNNVCSNTLFRPLTISQCCCGMDNTAKNPRGWGNPCIPCPIPNTANFKKVCMHGLGKDSGGKDIDECSNNVGGQIDLCPNGECRNSNGDYSCDCDNGYRATANQKECKEVDECRENPSLCHRGRCENVPGSYKCVCPVGFVFDPKTKGCEDNNECENPKQCIDGVCINSIGSFRCQCPPELTLHESGRICQDLREGKCWRKYTNGRCEDNVNGDVTREVCCQTLGLAWGSPCETCSTGKCRIGYQYQNFTCVDIDECESYPGVCRNGRCVNTEGSYQCECSQGLTLDESKSVCLDQRKRVCYQGVTRDRCTKPVLGRYKKDICCCSLGAAWGRPCEECPLKDTREFGDLCKKAKLKDVDECTVFSGICANGECINTLGSFICNCRFGFDLDETGRNCTDINECGLTLGLCGNGTCVNIPGGFRCNCQTGFKNAPMMMEICIDVDECDDLPNPCQGGTCVNTYGSFKCQCPPGKRMDPSGLMCQDVNECSENLNVCPNGVCQNFMGGYQCACYRGFKPTDDMKNCIDINECEIGKGGCEETCRNTKGSFVCTCLFGYRLDFDRKSCKDINECEEAPGICGGVDNKCRNVLGGHVCTCSEAYIRSEDQKSCVDIDECESDPDTCQNGECINTLGSFRCECGEGFVLAVESMTCVDVNECDTDIQRNCGKDSFCVNSIGSYSCTCKEGYEKVDDGCIDIDECSNGDAECGINAMCSNTPGSHGCVCKDGYQGDGKTCTDIDECSEQPSLCANGRCMNGPGSYICDCDFGYLPTLDNDGCKDVDECSALAELCQHGKCINIPGSFHCVCDTGFQLNRYRNNCTDMNECKETGMCLNGRCVNEMGRYRCVCDRDFVPNSDSTACIDTRRGPCHLRKGSGSNSCSNLVADNVLRAYCCCSVGEAWNDPCEECPINGTENYRHLCPNGVGFVVDPSTTSLLDINECVFPKICVGGTCVNTLGSFTCTCALGYRYNPGIGSCEDIDECGQAYICGWTGVCMNTRGGYRCACLPGETLVGSFCVDLRQHTCYVDEQNFDNVEGSSPGTSCVKKLTPKLLMRSECCCTLGTAFGDPDMCKACPVRSSGEYSVLCPTTGTRFIKPRIVGVGGATPFPPGGTPWVREDVDECSDIPNLCVMGKCINTFGSFRCECNKGFTLRADTKKCEDEDECILEPCKDGRCKNTFGSFMCTCEAGYTVDETGLSCIDHNECHVNGTCANGQCVNLVGDYRCLCNHGFQLGDKAKSCKDVNECLNRADLCGGNGTCVNKVGTYGCRCDRGFQENSRRRCEDIDECSEQSNDVCRNGVCINSVGSFSCDCSLGYTPDDTKRNCRDIDECREVSGYCQDGACVNTIGGSRCECSNGYRIHPAGDKCVDINECDEDANLCQMNGNCVNVPGSFSCVCPTGYSVANRGKMCVDMRRGYCFDSLDSRGCSIPRMLNVTKSVCCCTKGAGWGDPCDICPPEQTENFALLCPKGTGYAVQTNTVEDVNECEKNPALCKNGRCINNDGSYRCQCSTGYIIDDTGRNCKDKNECNIRGVCGNGTCTNIAGSYKCNCATGFKPGWSTPSCQDINECSENRNLCAFRCVNTPGGYQCICPRGYRLHADGRHCTDVDECVARTDNCGFSVCKNFIGGFKCICPTGHRRVGPRQCIDINECRENTGRCINGVCRNMPGGFICDCNSGYKRSVDGKSCEDLSRGLCFSQVDNGMCQGSSKQMMMVTRSGCCCSAGKAWGSQCTLCPRPRTRDHQQLCTGERKEMNECKMIPGLCPNGKCINTFGSYRCMCNPGFKLSTDGKSCVDINECTETPKPCQSECENTPGSYRCKCPEGYQQRSNQRTCEDINECANKSNKCQNTCVNTVGSYTCSCPKGYRQNGASCTDINECQVRPTICGFGKCVNELGTYSCLCQRGYKYNPLTKTCTGLNQCNIQTCQGTCSNLNGGYRCGCPAGYVKQTYWNQCFDVNECRTGANKCGSTQCVNIRGGYRCSCPQGYQLDRQRMACSDVNECSRSPCTSSCYNIRGGFQCRCPTGFVQVGGGHCISRYGQSCYNCGSRTIQRPKSIVTGSKYKFGENPVEKKATPARLYSSRFSYPENPLVSPRGYQTQPSSQRLTKPANPYRYTYSYGSSSGGRRRRASHYVHKLRMTVSRNLTVHDRLLELTPVLETLQKTFHYEILRGNKNLFKIKLHKGISALQSKKPLKNHARLHELYLKGGIVESDIDVPIEAKEEIEFSGSGVERKPWNNSELQRGKGERILGLSQAKKFHLRLFINVV